MQIDEEGEDTNRAALLRQIGALSTTDRIMCAEFEQGGKGLVKSSASHEDDAYKLLGSRSLDSNLSCI
eukprot:scaffold5019_cov131-Skeletonema_dohrnii-CCMP3373.AAC.5